MIGLILEAKPIVEAMLQDGLIVVSDVDVIHLLHPCAPLGGEEAGDAQRQ